MVLPSGLIVGEPIKESEWLKKDGYATRANGRVVYSSPIVLTIDGPDAGKWAGWKWSDGVQTFARNCADRPFQII